MSAISRLFLILAFTFRCSAWIALVPVSNSSSYTFMKQMRIFPYVRTVCDHDTIFPHCDISLDENYVYDTLPAKTKDMFRKVVQAYPDENVFIKYDDDVIVDYDYVLSVVSDVEKSGKMYLGDPMRCVRYKDARCMNGKFYAVSRSIAECFAYLVDDGDTAVSTLEDVFFGTVVYGKCSYLGYEYKSDLEKMIWHKIYHNQSVCIRLSHKHDHDCMAPARKKSLSM
jgi:hypothetical protein